MTNYNDIVATSDLEVLEGTEGADRFVFSPGASTTSAIDIISNWQPGDVIDLSSLGLSLEDLDVRLIGNGTILKLVQGFGADDFQLKVHLEGHSVDDVLASLIFDAPPPPNTPPVATDDSSDALADIPNLFNVLDNDNDADGDALTITAIDGAAISVGTPVSLASGNMVWLNHDGTLRFDAMAAVEADSFTYTIFDGEDVATATVNVNITQPVNVVTGTEEDDYLSIPLGTEQVFGMGGRDRIVIRDIVSFVDGGEGYDTMYFLFPDSPTAQGILLDLRIGTVTSLETGETGFVENFEIHWGSIFDDTLIGSDENDYLIGNAGFDILRGQDGNDALALLYGQGIADGGAGLDTLYGGILPDILTGGEDEDSFVFFGVEYMDGDVITDVELSDLIYFDGNPTFPDTWESELIFIGENAFSSTAGEIRYLFNGDDTLIEIDTDGDGVSDGTLTLQGYTEALIETDRAYDGISLLAVEAPEPRYNDVNFTADIAERNGGTDGADRYIFEPADSTTSAIDHITGWDPQDVIDLSALGLSADEIEVRLVGNGTIMKLIQGFGADDFQLKVSLNGHSVDDVLASIIFDGPPLPNTPPVATDDSADVTANIPMQINVLDNDSDADGDALTITAIDGTSITLDNPVTLASGNMVWLNEDGTLRFDALTSVETDSFTYTISDGEDVATASVNVNIRQPANIVIGTEENDVIEVPLGTDQVFGLSGNDSIRVQEITPLIDGGDGLDTVRFNLPTTLTSRGVEVDLAEGTVTSLETDEVGLLQNIERINGTNFDDTLYGSEEANLLIGGRGYDTLYGRDGNDSLWLLSGQGVADGGAGNDKLYGGRSPDILTGGDDSDEFYFLDLTYLANDVVTDFEAREYLYFERASGASWAWAFEMAFIGDSAFSNTAGEIRYTFNGTDTFIEVDADGDGVSDGTLILDAFDGSLVLVDWDGDGMALQAVAPPEPLYNDVHFTASIAERSNGTDGADRYIFEPADSTTSAIDHITGWDAQDVIDLSALGLSADELEVRLVGNGTIVKLIQGFGADEFQLKISLNGYSVQDVLDAVIYGESLSAEASTASEKFTIAVSEPQFDFSELSAPEKQSIPVMETLDWSQNGDAAPQIAVEPVDWMLGHNDELILVDDANPFEWTGG